MIRDGAEIIDVGGESSRPGAVQTSADEEMERVLPVIEQLAAMTDLHHFSGYSQGSRSRRGFETGGPPSSMTSPACAAIRT